MGKVEAQAVKRRRTCIACGAQDDKRRLMRIVRMPQGAVALDPTGRAAGRGAYVCSRECFEKASRGKRLSRALKIQVTEEDYARIAIDIERYGDSVQG